MTTMIAACGLDCSQCEAYTATQADDLLALERVVEKWSKEYNAPGMTIQCDSCMTEGRKIGYCAECGIRRCVVERGLANCAACPDYACEQLSAFFQRVPQIKINLDALR
jgi:Protein of unknown function (DUF3795)